MTYLGSIDNNCRDEMVYTKLGECNKKKGKIVALLVTGPNALYPIDKETFKTALPGYVTTNGSLRIIPINDITANTPSGGEVNAPEAGFSGPVPTNLTAFNMIYQIRDAGNCLLKELKKLNRRNLRFFEIDDEGFIYGPVVKKGDTLYRQGYSGSPFSWFTRTDGTTLAVVNFGIWYGANYEKEEQDTGAFELDEIPTGLTGVILEKGATSGTAKVVGVCDGTDHTSLYGDDWEPTMFVNASGANPTTVDYDSITGLITFAPITSYKVASASVLEAGNIVGLDGVNTLVDLT